MLIVIAMVRCLLCLFDHERKKILKFMDEAKKIRNIDRLLRMMRMNKNMELNWNNRVIFISRKKMSQFLFNLSLLVCHEIFLLRLLVAWLNWHIHHYIWFWIGSQIVQSNDCNNCGNGGRNGGGSIDCGCDWYCIDRPKRMNLRF